MESGQVLRGVGEIKKPPGPPPGAGVPISKLKPPPMAPPPIDINQSMQRPFIQNVKEIDLQKGKSSPSSSNRPIVPAEAMPARGPPPRGPVDGGASGYVPDAGYGLVGAGLKVQGSTTPKFAFSKSSVMKKAGAISMFENVVPPPQPPSESKDSANNKVAIDNSAEDLKTPEPRLPRPVAPIVIPPGIPSNQPLPPAIKPEKAVVPPPPIRPVPNRGRAPPKEAPPEDAVKKPVAPVAEPPFKKGYREPVAIETRKLKRREMEDPEFEESSGEEEETKNVVDAAKPVMEVPSVVVEEGSVGSPQKKRSVVTSDASISGVSASASTTLLRMKSSVVSQSEQQAPPAQPSASPEDPASAGTGKLMRQTSQRSVTFSQAIDNTQAPASPISRKTSRVSLARTNTAFPDEVPALEEESARGTSRGGLVPLPPPEAKAAAVNIGNAGGRFTIKCIEGVDIKKQDTRGDNLARQDVFLKFKLGSAEKFPTHSTEVRRKQDSNPIFDNELVVFDMAKVAPYVFNNDIVLYIEVMNSNLVRDELMCGVAMSVLRFFQHPYMTYREVVPLMTPAGQPSLAKVLELIHMMIVLVHL